MIETDTKLNRTNKLNIIIKYLLSVGNKMVIAKKYSGVTNHYWRAEDITCLKNTIQAVGPNFTLPDNNVLKSDQQDHLPISLKLSKTAKQATVLPHLNNSSLVSFEQLCDDNCKVLLNKKYIYLVKDNDLILEGHHNQSDGLWDIL